MDTGSVRLDAAAKRILPSPEAEEDPEEGSGMVYCHTVENFRPRKSIIDNNAPDYTDTPADRWTD